MVARCEWINVCKVMRTVLGTSRMLDVSYVQYNRCCSSHRALIGALLSKRTGRRLTLGPVLECHPANRESRTQKQTITRQYGESFNGDNNPSRLGTRVDRTLQKGAVRPDERFYPVALGQVSNKKSPEMSSRDSFRKRTREAGESEGSC